MNNSATGSYFLRFANEKYFEKFLYVRFTPLHDNLTNKVFFMDDDLLDWRSLLDIPLPYALRLFCKVTSKRCLILSSFSELWVSTPYLACKYAALKPRLLRPVASGPLLDRHWFKSFISTSTSTDAVRICYHGTWSHRDDMKWLAPVISEVQQRCPNTIFEVIGGDRVARIFRGIPRVSVLSTMSWPDYLKHTQNIHQDIGLAPLRDTLFNRGRGPIKFFDYARAGAVGVYSDGPAFSEFVSHNIDGYVLDNNPELWVDTIATLVNSPQLRQQMADSAWLKVLDNSPASASIQQYLNDLNGSLMQLSITNNL